MKNKKIKDEFTEENLGLPTEAVEDMSKLALKVMDAFSIPDQIRFSMMLTLIYHIGKDLKIEPNNFIKILSYLGARYLANHEEQEEK